MTPSPSFREKQRAIKAHSMPTVPSVGQILASQNGQMIYPQGQQQPSPTTSNSSHQSRRTPPPTSRISPVAAKVATQTERTTERQGTPPPLMHAHSQPIIPQLPNQHHPRPVNRVQAAPFLTQYQQEEHWAVTEELMAEFEQGQYGSHLPGTAGVAYAGGAASNRVKPRHESMPVPVPVSGPAIAPAKDPAVERVRATDRASPKDSDGGSVGQAAKRQSRDKERDAQAARESPKARDRSGTVSSQQVGDGQNGLGRTPDSRGSPQYQTPMASPGERTAAYTQYVPESYPSPPQAPSQAPTRKPVPTVSQAEAANTRLTPPATSKLTNNHTPPLQTMATRPPDRSLPVQEEPEEDVGHEFEHDDEPQYADRHHSSPTPSSDLYPEGHTTRYDARHEQRHEEDDDDETLNDEGDDHVPQNKSSEDSEAGFTPRSPSTNLPERPRDGQYVGPTNQYAGSNAQYGQTLVDNQKTIRQKPRGGATDQLGMRSFDPALFERDIHSLRGSNRDSPVNGQRTSQSPQQQQQQAVKSEPPKPPQQPLQQQPHAQYDPRLYPLNHILDQRYGYQWNGSEQQSDDMQSLMDDPTSSYLHTFLRSASARPGAPIPPTPQSHTAAPSPSPLISATPSDIEPRQIGSPYPYPFTHIRRSTVSGPMAATPSTNYDPNNPAVIREQLALQMQIYALNNGLAPPSSESAFSPSSTPFPGPGYNPWTFVPAAGTAGLGAHMAAASIRSSPSHEPVSLPPPPAMRARALRRREQNGAPARTGPPPPVRQARRTVKPPPRVDSTQPRETSPEPSSGEETSTAGEDQFVHQFVHGVGGVNGVNGNGNGNGVGGWDVNGVVPDGEDDGEWVDEEEEGEEEDLLDLEYHPSFVGNPQKRRRRFDTRWDALVQAFQALDRETDSTLVLLAAPSHSTKLHALTSRALRRDPTLAQSPALSSIRRSFSALATQRRAARKAQRMSLAERLSSRSDSSADGSPGANSPGEMDLRRALETALGSLGALSAIYEQREARWRDEMRRQAEDRERVELLLRQALGPVMLNGHAHAHHVGLHEHRRQKHADRYCVPCKRMFQNANKLDSHQRSATHQGRSIVFPMQGCGRAFVSTAALVLVLESDSCLSRVTCDVVDRVVAKYDRSNVITNPARLISGPFGGGSTVTDMWVTDRA
ncbi:hypothetical protein BD413DRAFT_604432 [Trametes elegans]|nr:hypothetical protein BD413DRAFT_604432 [Trametes elegans]